MLYDRFPTSTLNGEQEALTEKTTQERKTEKEEEEKEEEEEN